MEKLRKTLNCQDIKAADVKKMSRVGCPPPPMNRRLAACSVISDHDTPSDLLLAPLLFILILVLFMYRKPIQEFLSGSNSAKTSYGGLRKIQKKPPVRHF